MKKRVKRIESSRRGLRLLKRKSELREKVVLAIKEGVMPTTAVKKMAGRKAPRRKATKMA